MARHTTIPQEVEAKLTDALTELGLYRSVTESGVSKLETGVDVLAAEDLEARQAHSDRHVN